MNNFSEARVENVLAMHRDGQLNRGNNLAGLLCAEVERVRKERDQARAAYAHAVTLYERTVDFRVRHFFKRLRRRA